MAKVKSLKDPAVKMSKSDPNPLSRIDLMDSAEDIQQKLKKSTTDSVSKDITYDPVNRLGLANLIEIHAALSDSTVENVVDEIQTKAFTKQTYKEHLAAVINEKIQPINKEMQLLLSDRGHLNAVLKDGADRASGIAEATMKQVRELTGLS